MPIRLTTRGAEDSPSGKWVGPADFATVVERWPPLGTSVCCSARKAALRARFARRSWRRERTATSRQRCGGTKFRRWWQLPRSWRRLRLRRNARARGSTRPAVLAALRAVRGPVPLLRPRIERPAEPALSGGRRRPYFDAQHAHTLWRRLRAAALVRRLPWTRLGARPARRLRPSRAARRRGRIRHAVRGRRRCPSPAFPAAWRVTEDQAVDVGRCRAAPAGRPDRPRQVDHVATGCAAVVRGAVHAGLVVCAAQLAGAQLPHHVTSLP
jgi:hypothetical protein